MQKITIQYPPNTHIVDKHGHLHIKNVDNTGMTYTRKHALTGSHRCREGGYYHSRMIETLN